MPTNCAVLPTPIGFGNSRVSAHMPVPEPDVVPMPPPGRPVPPPPETPPEVQDPVLPGELEPVRDPVPPTTSPDE